MNLLIVEDDDDKLDDLVNFMRSRYEIETLVMSKSLSTGIESVLAAEYDLVLLDMTMRNFDRTVSEDGGRPHAFAGREILRQMRRNSIDTPVIVVTNFERFGDEADFTTLTELKSELEKRFDNYVGTIQYRANVDEWKDALRLMIDNTVRARRGA